MRRKSTNRELFFQLLIVTFVFTINVHAQSNFWQPVNGPFGGEVTALTVTDQGYVFAANGSFIFRADTDKKDWQLVRTGNRNSEYIRQFAVNNRNEIFAPNYWGGALIYSADNGESWERIGSSIPGNTGNSINAIVINDDNEIFIGGANGLGIYRSSNNGQSWKKLENGLTNNSINDLVINQNEDIWAGTTTGVFRSTDNGDSWTPKEFIIPFDAMDIDINSNGDLFVLGAEGRILLRSNDNAETWTDIIAGSRLRFDFIEITNDSTLLGFSNDRRLYTSTDNGDRWEEIIPNLKLDGFGSSYVHNVYGMYASINDADGIFHSANNGETWEEANNGLTAHAIRSIRVSEQGIVFAAASSGAYKSDDKGESWKRMLIGSPVNYNIRDFVFRKPGEVFVASVGGVYFSSDIGETWISISENIGGGGSVTFDHEGSLLASTSSGVYKYIEEDSSWQKFQIDDYNGNFHSLPFALSKTGNIYVAGQNGLFYSVDNGLSWDKTGNFGAILSLAMTKNESILVGVPVLSENDPVLYRSDDYGETWSNSSLGLYKENVISPVGDIAVNHVNGNIYATLSIAGVYKSIDDGNTWAPYGEGLENQVASSIEIGINNIWLGVTDGPVYLRSEPTSAINENNEDLPDQPILLQNYPNPFNPSTTIRFDIPKAGHITIKIYDLLGHDVRTLVDGFYEAGQHTKIWDSTNNHHIRVASGLYFMRIRAKDIASTRKLLLMK